MKNKTTLLQLKKVTEAAYKNAYFYHCKKKDVVVKEFTDFESLPTFDIKDIEKERLGLYAREMSEVSVPIYFYRCLSKKEEECLITEWNRRLEKSNIVLPLFEKDLQYYCSIIEKCGKFVYPRKNYDSILDVYNIIRNNDIDTVVTTSKNIIKLAQYLYNNNLYVQCKFICLEEHHNQDLQTRVNHYLSQDVLFIKIDKEICLEIGEVKNDKIELNRFNYYEIVDPDKFEPLPLKQYGLLTITTLNNDVMPLVRFKTKQFTRLIDGRHLDINSYQINTQNQILEAVIYMIEGVIDYSLTEENDTTKLILYCLNDIFFTNQQIEEEINKHLYFNNLKVVVEQISDCQI